MVEQSTPDPSPEGDSRGQTDALTAALESTLEDLSRSIDRMEKIISRLETGESDWEESVRLISEANELAISSSQKLDRVVQDVVYGSGREPDDADDEEDRQQTLGLP